jgi:hypothetical protein
MANEKISTHYYHPLKIIILAVLGGGGVYRNLMPSFHTNRLLSFLFTHHFVCFHHHLHAFTHKTYSVQKQLLDSLTIHFTKLLAMGGPVIRYEPATAALLELYPEVYQIFLQAGWLGYF